MQLKRSLLAVALSAVPAFAKKVYTVNAYWGQNGVGDTLGQYCESSSIDYVTVSFVNNSPENGGPTHYPGTNFAAHCAADVYTKDGVQSKLLSSCSFIKDDIKKCQALGKKVLLSIGGEMNGQSNYTVSTLAEGKYFAEFMFNAFGPFQAGYTGPRPFDVDTAGGDTVCVDGFDFDIEYKFDNQLPYVTMINTLRTLITEAKQTSLLKKDILITAAPQCPLSAQWFQMDVIIAQARFDKLFIQFYNNPGCDATTTTGFNYAGWEAVVAAGVNKDAELYVGLPGSAAAAGSGYITPAAARDVICEYRSSPRFAGVSIWDAYLASQNVGDGMNFYEAINEALNGCCPGETCITTSSTSSMSSTTTKATSTSTLPPTTTSTGNGISTPTPTQAGMTPNCDKFHFVVSGDICATIVSAYDVSLSDFYSWNPAVGTDCQSLWQDTYVCVGVTGSSVTASSMSSTSLTTSLSSGSGSTASTTSTTTPATTTSSTTSSATSSKTSINTPSTTSSTTTTSSSKPTTSSTTFTSTTSSTKSSTQNTPSSYPGTTNSTTSASVTSSTSGHYPVTNTTSSVISTSTPIYSNYSSTAVISTTSTRIYTNYSSTPVISTTSTRIYSNYSSTPVLSTTSTRHWSNYSSTSTSTRAWSTSFTAPSYSVTPTSSGEDELPHETDSSSYPSTTPSTSGTTSYSSTSSSTNTCTDDESATTASSDIPETPSSSVPTTTTTFTGGIYPTGSLSDGPVTTTTTSSSSTTESYTTSTVMTTRTYTVTSCAPEITNCPGKGAVVTETTALYTTVCPVTETDKAEPVVTPTYAAGGNVGNGGSESSPETEQPEPVLTPTYPAGGNDNNGGSESSTYIEKGETAVTSATYPVNIPDFTAKAEKTDQTASPTYTVDSQGESGYSVALPTVTGFVTLTPTGLGRTNYTGGYYTTLPNKDSVNSGGSTYTMSPPATTAVVTAGSSRNVGRLGVCVVLVAVMPFVL